MCIFRVFFGVFLNVVMVFRIVVVKFDGLGKDFGRFFNVVILFFNVVNLLEFLVLLNFVEI